VTRVRLALVLLVLASAAARAADEAPAWVKQAASITATFEPSVPAATLLDDRLVTVHGSGLTTTVERSVIRVLTLEGRRAAYGTARYLTDAEGVTSFEAWHLRPGAQWKRYKKEQIVDMTAAPNDVYNESRVQLISGVDDVEPGSVFAYEWTLKSRSTFAQFEWPFQGRNPSVLSRFSIVLPEGWRAEGVMFNHPPLPPTVTGDRTSWQMRDLPYIPDEPGGPAVTNVAPLLAVSTFPPAGAPSVGSFATWSDVSRWISELGEASARGSDALAAAARDLVKDARTERERIEAIGRFVQGISYISVQTGVGRGGGYRPHPAVDVFTKRFGDCKDKANLMRVLLGAAGVKAHMVTVYHGDRAYVREEWPSPQQFNHAIVAAVLTEPSNASSVLDTKLGRLFFFDPTDEVTRPGDLPAAQQGSLALVIAGKDGTLVRLPATTAEQNRVVSRARLELESDGTVRAEVKELATGSMATAYRRDLKEQTRPEYLKSIESWFSRSNAGAKLTKIEPLDGPDAFTLDVAFTAPRWAQAVSRELVLVKPSVAPRRRMLSLSEPRRTLPLLLDAHASTQIVEMKVPAGFVVDELPDPVALETPFGTYRATTEKSGTTVTVTRDLVLRRATIPAADVAAVRGFFEKLRAADDAPIVLRRE
jgi:transglutaminase-like putative cysteine protease